MDTIPEVQPSAPPLRAPAESGWHTARGFLLTVVEAGILFLFISTFLQNFWVTGSSMFPNVHDGQKLVVNKASYREFHVGSWAQRVPFLDPDKNGIVRPFGDPRRGDVVIFHAPPEPTKNFIKRVIGLPGETVEVKAGIPYINGLAIKEDYITRPDTRSVAAVKVPPDEFYVMGDERADSYDSRSWGLLPREKLIGKAWLTYWPFSEIGIVKNLTPPPGKG